MRKLTKALLALLASGFFLLLAAILLLPQFINSNDYKGRIIGQFKQLTGRDLIISGDIQLSLFPRLALQLGKTQLSNKPGFQARYFALIEQLQLQLKLSALLRKQIEIEHIKLSGLQLFLETKANGENNWQDLLVATKTTDNTAPSKPQQTEAAPMAWRINTLQLANAHVHLHDAQHKIRSQFLINKLTTGAIQARQLIPIHLDSQFNYQHTTTTFQLHTQLWFDEAEQKLLLAHNRLKLQLNTPEFSTLLSAFPTLSAFATGQQKLDMSLAQLMLQQHRTTTAFILDMEKLSVDLAEHQLRLPRLKFDSVQQKLHIEALELQTADLKLQLTQPLQVTQLFDQAAFQGGITIQIPHLAQFLTKFGLSMPALPPGKLTAFNLHSLLQGSREKIQLQSIDLMLDEQHLQGQLALSHQEKPRIRFDLAMAQLNMDAYLPQPAPDKKTKSTNTWQLPINELKALDIQGTLKVGKLQSSGLTMQQVLFNVHSENNYYKKN